MAVLLPFIQQQFNGTIWRMEIDGLTDHIFMEVRNADEKLVSFAAINLLTGQVNFTGLTTPERWLTGIEAAYNGVLLLHNYQLANSPVHKGLTAVDALTGAILWSNYALGLDHLSVSGAVVFNQQVLPKRLYVADIKTGSANRLYDPLIDTEAVIDIIAPQLIPIAQLSALLPVEAHGNSLHYLGHNNFIIVSLHSVSAGQLTQRLYVMDDVRVIYEDILNSDIQKIQPEAFIIYKSYLIYIKNKTELRVLNL